MRKFIPSLSIFLVLLIPVLSACSGGSDDPAAAVEAYTRALVEKDAAGLATLSCADWEDDALLELESFGAVTATLVGLDCQESSRDGDLAAVTCQGTITANYGNEVLEINLADRTYQVALEDGEWRMCGYR